MRFFLFILANAMLFIRPSELIPDPAAVEIYRWFILACLVVSLPAVFQQASIRFPGVPPIVLWVVLLLPSILASGFFHGDSEGLPTVIFEAMAEGAPVVGSRHAGIAEAVAHDRTGLLVPPLVATVTPRGPVAAWPAINKVVFSVVEFVTVTAPAVTPLPLTITEVAPMTKFVPVSVT